MKKIDYLFLEDNLLYILNEMQKQEMSKYDDVNLLSWNDGMTHIYEHIDIGGEYVLAYDIIGGYLENYPCVLSGKASIKLLELGLIFKYKSELEEDAVFDFRECCKDCKEDA